MAGTWLVIFPSVTYQNPPAREHLKILKRRKIGNQAQLVNDRRIPVLLLPDFELDKFFKGVLRNFRFIKVKYVGGTYSLKKYPEKIHSVFLEL